MADKKVDTNPRARSFCFTINNYTFDDLYQFLDIEAKYKCFGFEEGEEKRTPHMQGYLQFHNGRRIQAVMKMLPRAHIQIARGTPQENIDYCSKADTDDFYEFGDRPTEGGKHERTTEDILEALKDPMNNLSLVRHYANTVKIAKQLEIKTRKQETEFYVLVPEFDGLSEVLERFPNDEWVHIEELTELAYYEDPENIIFEPNEHDFSSFKTRNYWTRGKPILYKSGYEYKAVKPKKLVLITGNHKLYPLYKRI